MFLLRRRLVRLHLVEPFPSIEGILISAFDGHYRLKKVDLLEAEVDDLNRSVQALQDENAFLQRLLADPSSRSTLPRPPA